MGKNNKKGLKANVFKVAGAKSLKKTKAKALNLGLKNIKQKVQEMDTQFLEINKTPKSKPTVPTKIVKQQKKKTEKKVSPEDVSSTAEKIMEMDL